MQKAIAAGDGAGLEQTAHNFKAVAGIFEASEAVRLAQQLETMGASLDLAEAQATLEELKQETARVSAVLQQI
jgi:HPt (histidine-containing phosphotransfer) domain-containing protein